VRRTASDRNEIRREVGERTSACSSRERHLISCPTLAVCKFLTCKTIVVALYARQIGRSDEVGGGKAGQCLAEGVTRSSSPPRPPRSTPHVHHRPSFVGQGTCECHSYQIPNPRLAHPSAEGYVSRVGPRSASLEDAPFGAGRRDRTGSLSASWSAEIISTLDFMTLYGW
jgi:hypothetical protein